MRFDGGYVTAWNDARYFQPKDTHDVLVHLKGDARLEWRFGCYMDNGEYQQIYFDEHYSLPYSDVDYWMDIPPIPETAGSDE